MKTGKVSESVLKRSILKQIHTRREEVLIGAGVGEDCAFLALAEDEAFAVSTDPVTVQSQGQWIPQTPHPLQALKWRSLPLRLRQSILLL